MYMLINRNFLDVAHSHLQAGKLVACMCMQHVGNGENQKLPLVVGEMHLPPGRGVNRLAVYGY